MKDFYIYFYRLRDLAKSEYGYFLSTIRPIHTSNVNHTLKRIEIKQGNNVESLYEFCHELGHCYLYKKKFKRGYMNEILAWIIGINYCRKAKIPFGIKYINYALYCLKTHKKMKWFIA